MLLSLTMEVKAPLAAGVGVHGWTPFGWYLALDPSLHLLKLEKLPNFR